jgi:hypothetical protein
MNPRTSSLRASARRWLLGTLLALIGVVLARLVAPTCTKSTSTGLTLVGQLLGLTGLFIIARGIRRRLHEEAAATSNST